MGIRRKMYGTLIFRHSAAQHLLDAGADPLLISDLLSHSNSRTLSVYARQKEKVVFDAYRKYIPDFDLLPFEDGLALYTPQ